MLTCLCKILPLYSAIEMYLHKKPIPVEWKKPGYGWTKLNFDGSCKGPNGSWSSIGGLVRDHKAQFLLGYAESIGPANSTLAELAALRRGLELVVEHGLNQRVWVEGDAKTLVDILEKRREVRCLEVRRHISHINSVILPELENFVVSHIYREGNRAAHKFAQMGHHLDKPRIWRDVPPHEVLTIVHEDAQGKIVLRRRGLAK
ncbi:putative ribonuclease H protein [Senna tora]|uniref:Putative ribonuclease H protein n=1 Tax=Senna tora TaxID=362788 RepID=A0A834W2M6_9FABA|nr:putative ribonuclease H protein [Senna tora]